MLSLTSLLKFSAIASVVLVLVGFFNNPKRYRYLIPEKFSGTVYVYFKVPGASPLKIEDGFQLIVVPENGVVKTSSEPIGGKLHDEFWLYSGEKRYRIPPNKIGGGGTTERKNALGQQEIFFQFNVLK